MHDTPPPTGYAAPGGAARWRELRAGWDATRLAVRLPQLLGAPRGDGRVAVLVPGFGANDTSLLPLRTYLRRRDHDARGWGLGTNGGDVDALLEATIGVVEQLADDSGRPVNLIGWSLGGVLARETARDRPDLVHRVASFGTPLLGPRYTAVRSSYSDAELEHIEASIEERHERPITVPTLAFFSPNDGVVDWRTCPDRRTPGAVNVEVSSSHLGMGLDPTVWSHLANWLAADSDTPDTPRTPTQI